MIFVSIDGQNTAYSFMCLYSTVHNVTMSFMIMNRYLFIKDSPSQPENWKKPSVAVAGGMSSRVLSLRMWFLLWFLGVFAEVFSMDFWHRKDQDMSEIYHQKTFQTGMDKNGDTFLIILDHQKNITQSFDKSHGRKVSG